MMRKDAGGGEVGKNKVCIIFTVPYRPSRKCGFRVLRRRPRVWFTFNLSRLIGNPYSHCCFSTVEVVRNVNLWSPKPNWYAHMAVLHHPCLGAVVLMGTDAVVTPLESVPPSWCCVADVRKCLSAHGIRTRWTLSVSGLFKQLESHSATKRLLVHSRVSGRSDPRA